MRALLPGEKMNPYGKERTIALYGQEKVDRLSHAHVALFGLGGVGGYALEVLARSGIGELTLVDGDVFAPSNLNRQILSTQDNVGEKKVDAAAIRVRKIFPETIVHTYPLFINASSITTLDFSKFDFVLDAIDTISSKVLLVEEALKANVPIISCMGAGNKKHPEMFRVVDLFETYGDPLSKVMRKLCKEKGIASLPVVFSPEPPLVPAKQVEGNPRLPASNAFAPASAGILLATYAVQKLMK